MKKCDVIIPIYNSPEWVKLCVYALFKNTPEEYINKVILMNDNSNSMTLNFLNNLKEKYPEKILLKTNKQNLGFVKNVNAGLELSTADTVLLLNTDCLLASNTIPKLIAHLEKDEKIGLICPLSSNAANLSLEMYEGYSYMQMDKLLEENFKGKNFDACTVVGNCLMITKECLNKVGKLDEIYGMGYGEETDYQFKSEEKGFLAKVAIDTYVYHKSEVSFGTSQEKQDKLNANRKIFFDRWGTQYEEKIKKYLENDPIKYVTENLDKEKIKKISPEILFFLPDIHQGAGGVHVVIDIVNYLNINGKYASVLTERIHDGYNEIMIFNPCYMKNIKNITPKCIVGTIYPTIFFCKTIAEANDIPCVNFMQGYEPCFDNAEIYSWAELACRNSQNILAISNFLKNKCKDNFNKDAHVISNGINIDLLYCKDKAKKSKNEKKVITICLRDNVFKGDFILLEILKKLTLKEYNIEINIIYKREIMFPVNNSNIVINKYKGPLKREKVFEIMTKTDIYIDASLMEGFGLMALEAMAAGVVPIMSNSFGIDDYAEDGKNSFIINNINDVDKYMEKVEILLENEELLNEMSENAKNKALEFDFDKNISKYIEYFENVKKQDIKLTNQELEMSQRWYVTKKMLFEKKEEPIPTIRTISRKRKCVHFVLKFFPKPLKVKVKNIIKRLVND